MASTGSNPKLSDMFRNESIFLQAETTVYSVDRQVLLKDSEFFRELFELPRERGLPVEGSSAEHPLRIEGIGAGEFELWLRAVFPRYPDDTISFTCVDWVIVLKYLIMWRFNFGTLNVLKRLQDSADPITKILLCQQYQLDAKTWIIPSAEALARRRESLTVIEGKRLGWDNAMKISSIRERYSCCCEEEEYWKRNYAGTLVQDTNCCKREEHSFRYACEDAFKDDLQKPAKY